MNKKSKVILLPCNSYREELVYENLETGLELLGSLESIVGKEESVLLKPNLLKKAEVDKAVITHPVIVGMFARLMREKGYQDIILADSCGNGTTTKVIHGTGMDTYLDKFDIPAIDYTKGVNVENPDGIQAKEFVLPAELLERDCVISLCKMKSACAGTYHRGGQEQLWIHLWISQGEGAYSVSERGQFRQNAGGSEPVCETTAVYHGWNCCDGGERSGSGDPAPMNVILMSQDPVALDSVFCHLIHLKPEMVPTNYHGEKMGLGTWKEEEIELLTPGGPIRMEDAVAQYGNPYFDVDRRVARSGMWERLAKALNIFQKKPYIQSDKCIRCGICVKSCPVPEKAVNFRNGRENPPVYDYRKCIRCFCCQEMCPEKAIHVK